MRAFVETDVTDWLDHSSPIFLLDASSSRHALPPEFRCGLLVSRLIYPPRATDGMRKNSQRCTKSTKQQTTHGYPSLYERHSLLLAPLHLSMPIHWAISRLGEETKLGEGEN